MTTAVIGLALILCPVLIGLIAAARRERPDHLGSVSRAWLIENRIDYHDRG